MPERRNRRHLRRPEVRLDEGGLPGALRFLDHDLLRKRRHYGYARFRSDALDDAVALDCHLGAKSPAIDAGDPTSDWRLEPKPNGKRVNLGYYGNTPEATMSPKLGLFIIVR